SRSSGLGTLFPVMGWDSFPADSDWPDSSGGRAGVAVEHAGRCLGGVEIDGEAGTAAHTPVGRADVEMARPMHAGVDAFGAHGRPVGQGVDVHGVSLRFGWSVRPPILKLRRSSAADPERSDRVPLHPWGVASPP